MQLYSTEVLTPFEKFIAKSRIWLCFLRRSAFDGAL